MGIPDHVGRRGRASTPRAPRGPRGMCPREACFWWTKQEPGKNQCQYVTKVWVVPSRVDKTYRAMRPNNTT